MLLLLACHLTIITTGLSLSILKTTRYFNAFNHRHYHTSTRLQVQSQYIQPPPSDDKLVNITITSSQPQSSTLNGTIMSNSTFNHHHHHQQQKYIRNNDTNNIRDLCVPLLDYKLIEDTILQWTRPLPTSYLSKPLVLVGPSGVGKGRLVRAILKDYSRFFQKVVTHTTR